MGDNVYNDKELLRDYLENDNLRSLYIVVFEIYANSLKSIISKELKTVDVNEINDFLNDFYVDLIETTGNGEKKLRNFDFGHDLEPYLKQSLRNYILSLYREEQRIQKMVQSIEDTPHLEEPMDITEDYSEMYGSLLRSLHLSERLSARDKYIMLTYLLIKIGNPEMTDLKIFESLANQLGITEPAVKKAHQRAINKLKENMLF